MLEEAGAERGAGTCALGDGNTDTTQTQDTARRDYVHVLVPIGIDLRGYRHKHKHACTHIHKPSYLHLHSKTNTRTCTCTCLFFIFTYTYTYTYTRCHNSSCEACVNSPDASRLEKQHVKVMMMALSKWKAIQVTSQKPVLNRTRNQIVDPFRITQRSRPWTSPSFSLMRSACRLARKCRSRSCPFSSARGTGGGIPNGIVNGVQSKP